MATTNTAHLTMRHDDSNRADEAAISVVIGAITNAVRANNVDAMLSHCAHDIAVFDLVPPLKHQGAEAVRRLWATTLARFDVHSSTTFTSSRSRLAATSLSAAA